MFATGQEHHRLIDYTEKTWVFFFFSCPICLAVDPTEHIAGRVYWGVRGAISLTQKLKRNLRPLLLCTSLCPGRDICVVSTQVYLQSRAHGRENLSLEEPIGVSSLKSISLNVT